MLWKMLESGAGIEVEHLGLHQVAFSELPVYQKDFEFLVTEM